MDRAEKRAQKRLERAEQRLELADKRSEQRLERSERMGIFDRRLEAMRKLVEAGMKIMKIVTRMGHASKRWTKRFATWRNPRKLFWTLCEKAGTAPATPARKP